MNLKQVFVFSIAFTCLAPNIFAASAAQSGVVADSEDSRYQSTPHASTSLDGISIASDNLNLHDVTGRMMMLEESKAIPALNKSTRFF